MDLNVIFYLISIILGALSAGIPILIKWIRAKKAKKTAVQEIAQAKTEADLAKAESASEKASNDMLECLIEAVILAEKTFSGFDKVMKAQNSSAGGLKKENVMTRLQAYALSKNYVFDAEFWSKKIDEIVAFTKEVNSKKNF